MLNDSEDELHILTQPQKLTRSNKKTAFQFLFCVFFISQEVQTNWIT